MPQVNLIYRVCTAFLLLSVLTHSGCRWASTGQNTLGTRLYQEGRYAEALQQFQAAQTADPTDPDAYYNLARTYHQLGVAQKNKPMIDQAEALYNQCLDLSGQHADCYRGLAVLLCQTDRSDKAFTLMKNWAQQNPQSSDARVELARLYEESGQDKVAEKYLDEALAINPASAEAWAAKGKMREKQGELALAVQNYYQSLSVNKLQPELAQHVATLNIKIAQNAVAPAGTTNPATGTRTVQNPAPPAASPPRY
jgi:Flp pilus assembly protein TadD